MFIHRLQPFPNVISVPLPPDSVGEDLFFGLSIRRVRPFVYSSVRSFIRTDFVTAISYERLEKSRLNLQ